MKRKYSGSTTAVMAMFLLSGVLVSVLGMRQLDRFNTHEVWGIKGDWPAGVLIKPNMLRQIRITREFMGIRDPRHIVGKRLMSEKRDGDPLEAAELMAPPRSWLAQQIPDGKVLYTFIPHHAAIPYSQIRNGDHFDILASGRNGVRVVASNAQLIGALAAKADSSSRAGGLSGLVLPGKPDGGSSDTPLVIAVAPDEVYPLASIGAEEEISIVLHGSEQNGLEQRPSIIPAATHRQVEVLSGRKRTRITVEL